MRILVVGQTPPPLGGQAMMIQYLLDGQYQNIELYHVRMNFSRELDSTGKWSLAKLWVLAVVIVNIFYARIRHNVSTLYYPPSGARLLPVARDVVVLCATRWLFRSTIFHFHASGLSEFRDNLKPLLRPFFDLAYSHPDLAIRLSKSAPAEGPKLGCKQERIIANGIPDEAGSVIARSKTRGETIHILFVALMSEDKGVLVAVAAAVALIKLGMAIKLTCMGRWESPDVRVRAEAMIEPGMSDCFDFPGVLTGGAKWSHYRRSDIFCFPSFFYAETFPVVLLEAMSFSLPIVSTRWRGIPDLVEEGNNAMLVEKNNVAECAAALKSLIQDPVRRATMGRNSRERFVQNYTIAKHRQAMERAFLSLTRVSEEIG